MKSSIATNKVYAVSYAWTTITPSWIGLDKSLTQYKKDNTFCAWCNKSQTEILKNGEDLNEHIEKHDSEEV